MKIKLLKVIIVAVLISVLLSACGRNRNNDNENDNDYTDPPQVEEPAPPPPTPEPPPPPGPGLLAISVPIISGFGDLSYGGNYIVDKDTDGEYLEYENEIFIGWDGVDTLFVRTTFRDAAGISIAVSLAPAVPDAGESGSIIEIREHSISFLGNNEGFIEWSGRLGADLLHYILRRGYVYGEIAVNTAFSNALLGDTGGYLQFIFQQPELSVVHVNLAGGFNDFANIRHHYFTYNADGSYSDSSNRVQLAWNGRDTVFMRFTVMHPHGAIYNTRAANAADWREDDIVEVFMLPTLLANNEENRATARHWASNSETVFHAPGGDIVTAAHSGFINDMWIVDMAVLLDHEMREAVYNNGLIYGSMAVVLNSAGQELILGRTGEFWDAGTILFFSFEGAQLVFTDGQFETKRGVVDKNKFCEP